MHSVAVFTNGWKPSNWSWRMASSSNTSTLCCGSLTSAKGVTQPSSTPRYSAQALDRGERQAAFADLFGDARQVGLLALVEQHQVVASTLAVAQEQVLDALVGQFDALRVIFLDGGDRGMLDPLAVDGQLAEQRQKRLLVHFRTHGTRALR